MTTIIEALRKGLDAELDADERVFVMGEDIGIGGSFHLTLGLPEKYGSVRIRDTPVAEAGFVGLAIGAAIGGLRPVVDFQYGDFLLPAADQVIQQACKLNYMSGGQVQVPIVLHAPTGASGRGAQHANSIENFFFGVPGLIVGVPSTPYDAKGMMTTAIRSMRAGPDLQPQAPVRLEGPAARGRDGCDGRRSGRGLRDPGRRGRRSDGVART